MTHRWSGWPGAFCLDCGNGDPMEDALVCSECHLPAGPDDPDQETRLCALHELWAAVSCPPSREDVLAINAMIADREGRT